VWEKEFGVDINQEHELDNPAEFPVWYEDE
jgi:hypothetical protein